MQFTNDLGEFRMESGRLDVAPAEHFANEESARKAIEPFLMSWELDADLMRQPRLLRFRFDRAEFVDRDPPLPGTNLIAAVTEKINVTTYPATLDLAYQSYPLPPTTFSATTAVQIVSRRWMQFRDGGEPLPSMAYFVLTFLESMAGSRRAAAQMFRIEFAILSKIGELSSKKGGEATARKVEIGSPLRELTAPEQVWLEAAVRRTIYRIGEHAAGAQLEQVVLADLPDLH